MVINHFSHDWAQVVLDKLQKWARPTGFVIDPNTPWQDGLMGIHHWMSAERGGWIALCGDIVLPDWYLVSHEGGEPLYFLVVNQTNPMAGLPYSTYVRQDLTIPDSHHSQFEDYLWERNTDAMIKAAPNSSIKITHPKDKYESFCL